MKRLLFLSITLMLQARENPFILEEKIIPTVKKIYSVEKPNPHPTSAKRGVLKYRFAQFELFDDRIKIITKDPLKKYFLLDSPRKIVLDFYSKRDFPTIKKLLELEHFKKIEIGSHKNFYRVAISVDESCKRYKIQKGSSLELLCLED